jgi:hypothetical protein
MSRRLGVVVLPRSHARESIASIFSGTDGFDEARRFRTLLALICIYEELAKWRFSFHAQRPCKNRRCHRGRIICHALTTQFLPGRDWPD